MVKVFKSFWSQASWSLRYIDLNVHPAGTSPASPSVVEQTFIVEAFPVHSMFYVRLCHDYVMIIKHPHALEVISYLDFNLRPFLNNSGPWRNTGDLDTLHLHIPWQVCVCVCSNQGDLQIDELWDNRINRNTSVCNYFEHENMKTMHKRQGQSMTHITHITYISPTPHILDMYWIVI